MQHLERMTERVVLITGGGGGIARGIARAFADEGAKLILTDLFPGGMEKTKAMLEQDFGAEVFTYVADGAKEEEVKAAIEAGAAHFGKLNVVINNAQASASGLTLVQHSREDFDIAIHSGMYATFFYMKHAYPYLKETHGSVINFASGAGLFGNFGQSAYAAAKEGIRGMSRVAATEWGKDGINVNVVCPLAWTAKLEQFRDAYPDAFKANVKMPPMGHYGNAETEIGRVCVQLAMPDFKYMSGETLTLEGGMGQRP